MLELDSNLSAIQMLFKYVHNTLVIAATFETVIWCPW